MFSILSEICLFLASLYTIYKQKNSVLAHSAFKSAINV